MKKDKFEKIATASEQALRDMKVIWPESMEELTDYIEALTERGHDYGTCVYAMSMAATATFYYVSQVLGVTGFQASVAELNFIERTRHMKYGFRILDYEKILYPQYFSDKEYFPTAMEILEKNKNALAKAAKEKLEKTQGMVHPEVREHWEWIASLGEEKNALKTE